MAIPKDILAIERPKNTIVIRTNKTEPPRYAVRSRVGCIYDHGRRVPKNGPVIGHIDVEVPILLSWDAYFDNYEKNYCIIAPSYRSISAKTNINYSNADNHRFRLDTSSSIKTLI